MALPYGHPDPATGIWDPFALKRNLDYLDTTQVQQGLQRLSVQTGAVGNSGSDETTLFSYTVPANKLSQDGQRLSIVIWGNTAANANNKFYRVYWGGDLIFIDNGAHNTIDFYFEGRIIRTGAQTQSTILALWYQGTIPPHIDYFETTADLRVANEISFTGQGSATNDIIGRGFEVMWLP